MPKTIPCPHCGKPIDVQNAQRVLKALDKVSRTCEVCGKDFVAQKKAKFCSNACKQRAKYACQKAAAEAAKDK